MKPHLWARYPHVLSQLREWRLSRGKSRGSRAQASPRGFNEILFTLEKLGEPFPSDWKKILSDGPSEKQNTLPLKFQARRKSEVEIGQTRDHVNGSNVVGSDVAPSAAIKDSQMGKKSERSKEEEKAAKSTELVVQTAELGINSLQGPCLPTPQLYQSRTRSAQKQVKLKRKKAAVRHAKLSVKSKPAATDSAGGRLALNAASWKLSEDPGEWQSASLATIGRRLITARAMGKGAGKPAPPLDVSGQEARGLAKISLAKKRRRALPDEGARAAEARGGEAPEPRGSLGVVTDSRTTRAAKEGSILGQRSRQPAVQALIEPLASEHALPVSTSEQLAGITRTKKRPRGPPPAEGPEAIEAAGGDHHLDERSSERPSDGKGNGAKGGKAKGGKMEGVAPVPQPARRRGRPRGRGTKAKEPQLRAAGDRQSPVQSGNHQCPKVHKSPNRPRADPQSHAAGGAASRKERPNAPEDELQVAPMRSEERQELVVQLAGRAVLDGAVDQEAVARKGGAHAVSPPRPTDISPMQRGPGSHPSQSPKVSSDVERIQKVRHEAVTLITQAKDFLVASMEHAKMYVNNLAGSCDAKLAGIMDRRVDEFSRQIAALSTRMHRQTAGASSPEQGSCSAAILEALREQQQQQVGSAGQPASPEGETGQAVDAQGEELEGKKRLLLAVQVLHQNSVHVLKTLQQAGVYPAK